MSGKTTAEPPLKEQAFALLNSLRGGAIISQALYYGIQELAKVAVPYQETSNLSDMRLLRSELFDFPVEDNRLAIATSNAESVGLWETNEEGIRDTV